ncbi:MAG: hypothetical protein PHQ23_01745, partial [Candidatus Wallbacteria bacterium]|nr:hypothetical protein [Candidatus Wallbacteria bacterium]
KLPNAHRPYRIPGGMNAAWLVVVIGSASVLLGILLPFMPGPDLASTREIVCYELQIGLGPLAIGLIGWALFRRHEKTHPQAQA